MTEVIIESGIPYSELVKFFALKGRMGEQDCYYGPGWVVHLGSPEVVKMGAMALTRTKLHFSGQDCNRIVDEYRLRFLSAGG